MRSWARVLIGLVVGAVVAVPAVAVPTVANGAAPPAPPPGKPLTVMTRNLYLGGDINRPIAAVGTATGALALIRLANENYALRQTIDQTDFPVRARLLAREIATRQPDLVGLQEVALWRSGPFQLTQLGVRNAEDVDYDFLELLTDALADAGASYRVVRVQEESDVEAPAFTGSALPTPANASDQRLTMRDVILMRSDKGLVVTDEGSAQYDARLPVSLGGIPLAFIRGYTWVDVRDGATRLRFINTHLESASSYLALRQAQELAAGPAAHDGNTVLVCDCNSDPLNGTSKPNDIPHWSAYRFLTGAGGFTDEWLTFAPADQGWTSGLSETVDDATADDPGPVGFDHRIDMVFVKSDSGDVTADKGWITGNTVADKDPATGLWPSDHAGVVLRLRGLG